MPRYRNLACRALYRFFIVGWLLVPTSCSIVQTLKLPSDLSTLPSEIYLDQVPFFPQQEFQCGPAALAEALTWHHIPTTPEILTPMIYVPAKQGSLQYEIMAATRRHALIPYVINPELGSLIREVAAGRPVLLLQNLGLSWFPIWHYAVAVGYNLQKQEIILRSGLEKEHVVSLSTFDRTWRRAQRWAIVVLRATELPTQVDIPAYTRAIAALESLGYWDEAIAAYSVLLQRWPSNIIASLGLGNSYYKKGETVLAEEVYRKLIKDQPQATVAYNNLAHLLMMQSRWDEAEYFARKAVENPGPLRATYQKTLQKILDLRH